MSTAILVFALLLTVVPHLDGMTDCARRLVDAGRTYVSKDRTKIITVGRRRGVQTFSGEDAQARLKAGDPVMFGPPVTVNLYTSILEDPSDFGPMNFLTPGEFDPELRTLIADILRESKNDARVRPALAANMRDILRSRARALRTWKLHYEQMSKHTNPSTIRYWRNQGNVAAQAAPCFENGVEVGSWVITFDSGERTILPIFSDQTAKAHCQIDTFKPFWQYLEPRLGRGVRSAAFFHNHPSGGAMISIMDIKATKELADLFPWIREFHIYAIAEENGRTQIGHYGLRN